jgi:hypothetical protein
MNQTFFFKNFSWPGWLILLMVPLIVVYFNYGPSLLTNIGIPLGSIHNGLELGIVFLLPLYILFMLVNYPMQALLKSKSYLEIKDGLLNLVILTKLKWSVPVNTITAMDAEQGQHSAKADIVKTLMSKHGLPMIGFSFTAQGQTYEVKNFLKDFEAFKQALTSSNPQIQFASVTQAANTDLYNEDIGKVIQEKAHGLPVLTGFGKFVSKLNLVSGFIIGLIITIALIVWLVIATNPK